MSDVDEHGRPLPPLAADEAASLVGFLDYQRATLAWKCAGLDAAGLATTVASSTLTLAGLLKHLAFVEELWFSRRLAGGELGAPWDGVDWQADPDWEFRTAVDDGPDALWAMWNGAVATARARLAEVLADPAEGGLDRLANWSWSDGGTPSVRWILLHMIEEYARHNGHADILRQAADGSTGE